MLLLFRSTLNQIPRNTSDSLLH